MLSLIAASFVLGFMVAVPPGSVTLVAAQRTLRFGFPNGLAFQFGSCVADSFYIVLVYAGVAAVIADSRPLRIVLWCASGALLAWMAFDALRPKAAPEPAAGAALAGAGPAAAAGPAERNNTADPGRKAAFFSGIGVTLLNPVTIVGWIALAGNFFLMRRADIGGDPVRFLVVLATMIVGVQAWFVPLLWAISRTGAFLGDRVISLLVKASGVFLGMLALLAFWSVYGEAFGR